MNPSSGLTWNEIVRLEPRLARLLRQARAVKDDRSESYFCANEIWYRDLKPQLTQLVGWDRGSDDDPAMQAWRREADRLTEAGGGMVDLAMLPALPRHLIPEGDDPRMHGSATYSLAYEKIYSVLPGCRSCGCLSPLW